MLQEWLQHLFIKAPPHLKQMGYLKEQLAMQSRYSRCRSAWLPHLQTSQKLLFEITQSWPADGDLIILGSGYLWEIPLTLFARQFQHIILVDLHHPPIVRKTVSSLPNVILHEADVTGLLEQIWPIPPQHEKDLSLCMNSRSLEFLREVSQNCKGVISVNCLSQLPLLPLQWLQKHGSKNWRNRQNDAWKNNRALTTWAKQIQQNHLNALSGLDCPTCLLTDTERLIIHQSGQIIDAEAASLALPTTLPIHTWEWEIAPVKEIVPDHRIVHRMSLYFQGRNAQG